MSHILIAGTDEVGRGPLIGNVVAAAVILDPSKPIIGLADSKKLSEKKRLQLFDQIIENALAYHIAWATPAEIDKINILHASMLAMTRAVEGLIPEPVHVLVDGNRLPPWRYSAEAIVKGDSKEPSISAASILAKVTRDKEMVELDAKFPDYGFVRHKGYPTREHLDALCRLGALPSHRRSFAPVKAAVSQLELI